MLATGSNKKPRRLSRYALAAGIVCLVLVVAQATVSSATAPSLGTAASFAVLGGSAVTNTNASKVTGDLGVSPGSSITGFPPGTVDGTIHSADAVAAQAQVDVGTAYDALTSQACDVDLTGQDLGGKTLKTGVYCFDTTAQLTGDLVLDAEGNSSAVFIFKMGSTLTTASGSTVSMINGGDPCNVFWQVGSSATLGTGTEFLGNLLALAAITLTTDANITGRALARVEAVTMDSNDVSNSACFPASVRVAGIRATPAGLPLFAGAALLVVALGLALLQVGTAARRRRSGSREL